jgi:predicted RNA-binding Zn-ribbon protein involved in translation (DUF1610 family)
MPSSETLAAATPKCPVGPNRPGLIEAAEPCGRTLSFDAPYEMWVCPVHGNVTTTQSLVARQTPLPPVRPYKRYRADGWPYCPQCDEDELWSNGMPACVETIVGCYSCGWQAASREERAE